MNGFEVCQKIRTRYDQNELPVIFLSARNELKDKLEGLAMKANDYLEKPVFKHELLARINNQILILIANRRLNALLNFSEKIGRFKDAKELVEFAFNLLTDNIFLNGAILLQGNLKYYKSKDPAINEFLIQNIIDQVTCTEKPSSVPISGNFDGEYIYTTIPGFEEFRIVLFRKKSNRIFQKSEIRFINNVINEIHLIRSNILSITHKHDHRDEIHKINQVLDQILYVKSLKSHCLIVLEKGADAFEVNIPIQKVELYFGGYQLLRIHRQYFAFMEKVSMARRKPSKDFELLIEDHQLPVGRTYLKKIQKHFAYLFE
jgi:DNA-binding LytR/AlgR family response regulator